MHFHPSRDALGQAQIVLAIVMHGEVELDGRQLGTRGDVEVVAKSAAEAQNGGRDPITQQYERFNDNPSKLFYRNEDQGEISATQPFAHQNCNRSMGGFSSSHQDFHGIVAQQQSDQEMGGFDAETDLQNLNQGIMGQQQLNPEMDVAINLELQHCDQSIVGQQQSDQEIGDFSAASDLDLQFNQAQQQVNHHMGGFNAERDLDPQQFNQGQQQLNNPVNHHMGGFNAERDLDPQQFNQGQQQLNHPMTPFNVEMAFNQSTMGEQQPNQGIEDFSAASDLDLQAQQHISHQMGGFNAERDLDPQQFNQAQQQLNREMRKFDFNSTLPIAYG